MRVRQAEELTDGTFDPPGVDYEALWKAWVAAPNAESPNWDWDSPLRAVIATYREQMRARGVVEVRTDDLRSLWEEAVDCFADVDEDWRANDHPSFIDALDRIEHALEETTTP